MKVRLVIILLLYCISVHSAEIAVNTTEQFNNALIDANQGDTIALGDAVFSGAFIIDKPVTIIGSEKSVVDGAGIGDVITINSDSTQLIGITVRNSGTRLLKDMAGIKILGNYVSIYGCHINDILHGIYVKGGNNILIKDNIIFGRSNIQESDRGNGIHLWNTVGNIVENNEISYARDGIYFSFAHETSVKYNHIHDLRYGLHYMYSNDNHFEENLFDYNVAGSALMYSEDIYFQKNIFAHCRGFRAYGILLQSVERCVAEGNLIIDNSRGIFFDDANYIRIEDNDIVQNDVAIQINASCEENSFIGNNFISNLASVMMDASIVETTYWNENGRGNFWSDYEGYDLDFNEIGDVPHSLLNVFEYIESDHPAIRFYLYSPAATLLEIAEKRLPILRRGNVEDTSPLFKIKDNNNVPWDLMRNKDTKASYIHLIIWIVLLSLPFYVLLGFK
jgi:nitrous oxidase accessory protein